MVLREKQDMLRSDRANGIITPHSGDRGRVGRGNGQQRKTQQLKQAIDDIRSYGVSAMDILVIPRNGELSLSIELDETVRVKMKTQGTKIAFEPRTPTGEELQDCPHT